MKKFLLAVAVAAVATMGIASSASAGVERYQTQTGVLTVQVSTGYVHAFEVAVNPCDGSFAGTGFSEQLNAHETIKGSLINGQLSFEATYTDQSNHPGYKWFTTSPGATGTWIPAMDSFFGVFQVTGNLSVVTTSTWKNHGEYVKAQGGGSDAAHSCIGMPIH